MDILLPPAALAEAGHERVKVCTCLYCPLSTPKSVLMSVKCGHVVVYHILDWGQFCHRCPLQCASKLAEEFKKELGAAAVAKSAYACVCSQ